MKHIINKKFQISYVEIENNEAYKMSAHSYIIYLIGKKIKESFTNREYKEFDRNIKELKQFRIDSDYLNKQIFSDQSEKSINLAKSIKTLLLNLYRL